MNGMMHGKWLQGNWTRDAIVTFTIKVCLHQALLGSLPSFHSISISWVVFLYGSCIWALNMTQKANSCTVVPFFYLAHLVPSAAVFHLPHKLLIVLNSHSVSSFISRHSKHLISSLRDNFALIFLLPSLLITNTKLHFLHDTQRWCE